MPEGVITQEVGEAYCSQISQPEVFEGKARHKGVLRGQRQPGISIKGIQTNVSREDFVPLLRTHMVYRTSVRLNGMCGCVTVIIQQVPK